MSGLITGNLLEDAKFYQDVAVELQTAYDTLQQRLAQQARLMEEASRSTSCCRVSSVPKAMGAVSGTEETRSQCPTGYWRNGHWVQGAARDGQKRSAVKGP